MVRRGDADEDNAFTLTDAIGTLNFLFLGGRPVCFAAADVDGSRDLTITDPINLLNHLFLGGPPPVPPYPDCGVPEGDVTACTGAACRS
jgi:hypothetical protein